jgi:hypothetical protein
MVTFLLGGFLLGPAFEPDFPSWLDDDDEEDDDEEEEEVEVVEEEEEES